MTVPRILLEFLGAEDKETSGCRALTPSTAGPSCRGSTTRQRAQHANVTLWSASALSALARRQRGRDAGHDVLH